MSNTGNFTTPTKSPKTGGFEKNKMLMELFEKAKEQEMSNYEESQFEFTIIECIQFSTIIADKKLSQIVVNKTPDEELPELMHQIITEIVKQKVKEGGSRKLPKVDCSTDLRSELKKAQISQEVQAYPLVEEEVCETTESPIGSPDEESTLCEESFEQNDEILRRPDQEHKESFAARYPNPPTVRCPRNLFVSTLSPGYINSLYITNNEAFPRQWGWIKKSDPVQAWNALNQTIIPYMNNKWGSQGVQIGCSETAVDLYNINALKSALVETVERALQTNLETPKEQRNNPSESECQMRELSAKMEDVSKRLKDWTRLTTSDLVKRTQVEVNPRPIVIQPNPSLSVASYQPIVTATGTTEGYKYLEEEIW